MSPLWAEEIGRSEGGGGGGVIDPTLNKYVSYSSNSIGMQMFYNLAEVRTPKFRGTSWGTNKISVLKASCNFLSFLWD